MSTRSPVGHAVRPSRIDGFALIATIVAILFLSAMAAALMVIAPSERLIAASHRNGVEALYAADAMAEWAVHELQSIPDWDQLISGEGQSSFVEGAPAGLRWTADGLSIDPSEAVNFANCGRAAACSPSDLVVNATGDRPWGSDNPVWRLFAYGPLTALLPDASVPTPLYVLSMVANDPSGSGLYPGDDGPAEGNPGLSTILLRAEAIGPQQTHKAVQLAVARSRGARRAPAIPSAPRAAGRFQVLSWHVVR